MSEHPNVELVPETVQTVQHQEKTETLKSPPKTTPFWEVAQDPETELYHFVLWSGNNRAMCISGRGYKRRNDAADAIDTLEEYIADKPRRLYAAD